MIPALGPKSDVMLHQGRRDGTIYQKEINFVMVCRCWLRLLKSLTLNLVLSRLLLNSDTVPAMLNWISSFLTSQKHKNSQDNPQSEPGSTQASYSSNPYAHTGFTASGPGLAYQPAGVQGGPMPPSSFNIPGAFGFYPTIANPVFYSGSLTPPGAVPPSYWTAYPFSTAPTGKYPISRTFSQCN